MIGRGPDIPGVDKSISRIALGTAWFSHPEKEICMDLLDDFTSYGGTVIDTARGYGASEEILGDWMAKRGNRDQVVVVTKGGLSDLNGGRLAEEGLKEKVELDVATSLERLKTDFIDIFLLHRDTISIPVAEIVDCLNDQLDSGTIGAFGGSNWHTWRVDEANGYARDNGLTGFSAVSNNVSLAVPTAPFYPGLVSTDKGDEAWHERTGMPLLSWSSQARGYFTGRYLSGSSEDPFARNMVRVYGTEENRMRLLRARELGKRKGRFSATQVALSWVLHRQFPILPIVGPHCAEELASCVQALDMKLDESEAKWLDLLSDSPEAIRGC